MIETEIGELEKREIRDQVDRILRDLGHPEPPLDLGEVRRLLTLDLQYYSSSDTGLVTELGHRFKLFAKNSIPDVGKHLLRALAYCMPATLLVWGHALTLVFQNAFWWTSPNLLARAVMDSTSFTGYLWVAWSFLYWHSFTSRYLRLDHPFLVTLLLLILSGLATAAIVVYGGNGLHSLSEFFA